MQIIADGKTKTVYSLGDDRVLIIFKDDVTGEQGRIDPGGNRVVGSIAGKGAAALRQSEYFFRLLARHGIPSHFIAVDNDVGGLIASRAKGFGLEFIVRFKAAGSFVRRYGAFVRDGDELGGLVEITLKDDHRGDPLLNDDTIVTLGIMEPSQLATAKDLVKRAAQVLRSDLARRGLELVDIKFECGLVDGTVVLIDDISTDNMRVLRGGEPVGPQDMLGYLGAG